MWVLIKSESALVSINYLYVNIMYSRGCGNNYLSTNYFGTTRCFISAFMQHKIAFVPLLFNELMSFPLIHVYRVVFLSATLVIEKWLTCKKSPSLNMNRGFQNYINPWQPHSLLLYNILGPLGACNVEWQHDMNATVSTVIWSRSMHFLKICSHQPSSYAPFHLSLM